MVVKIEAESLDLHGNWKLVEAPAASGGKYITWEGLQAGSNNRDANDGDIISTMIMIPAAGTYSFKVSFNSWVSGMVSKLSLPSVFSRDSGGRAIIVYRMDHVMRHLDLDEASSAGLWSYPTSISLVFLHIFDLLLF